ncbi:hypothetical protein D9M68_664690 [compost metagenome]
MFAKFLSRGFVATLFFANFQGIAASQTDIWSASNLGKCFPSTNALLTHEFGLSYQDDENIVHRQDERFTGTYYWAYDNTPSRNVTRLLVRKEESGRACVVLYAPFADSLSVTVGRQGALPRSIVTEDAPAPGFVQTSVTYQLEDKTAIYRPVQCRQQLGRSAPKKISCRNAFSQCRH